MANSRSTYMRLLHFLKPHKLRFSFSLFAMVAYGITDGAIPFLIRHILDDVFGKQNEDMLYYLTIGLVVFAVVRGIFSFFQHYLIATVGHRIVRDLRNTINEHLLTLSESFFAKHHSGTLISRVTNDTILVRSALTDSIASVLRDSVRVIVLLIAAISLDPTLGLIAFVGFPLAILPIVKFGKKVRRLSKVGQDQFGGLTTYLQEAIAGHRIVKAYGMEKYECQRFLEENNRLTKTFERAEKYGALSAPTNEIIASLAISAVLLYGGISVMSGVRTQGDFIAFLASMFLLYEPLKKMSRVNNTMQLGLAAADRIFEVIDTVPEIADAPDAQPLVVQKPTVVFDRVSFRYPPRETKLPTSANRDAQMGKSVNPNDDSEGSTEQLTEQSTEQFSGREWSIEDVSFTLKSGETLALVGMSGGGKSTIANLLLRFYDPQIGYISIDGHDIKTCSVSSLRQTIAYVGQHTFLFNDTVYNNIRYGSLDATDREIKEAARLANADIFIDKLPQSYNTILGEQGLSLSGGERSRLAIARALLRKAPILILDEATAALDSESEKVVQEAIEHLMKNKTVLVIAHRLATIRNANKIATIVNGRLVEYGTHDDLLAQNGEYAKLYKMQFAESTSSQEQQ